MKRALTLLLLSLIGLIVFPSFAQKLHKITKDEKNRAKEQVREYYSTDFGLCEYWKLKNSVEGSEQQVADLDTETQKYQDEISKVKREGAIKIDSLGRVEVVGTTSKPEVKKYDICTLTTGTVYKIQAIISDSDWEKTKIGREKTVFTGDEETEEAKVYTFACFTDKQEAEDFNQKLLDLKLNTKVEIYENGKKIK